MAESVAHRLRPVGQWAFGRSHTQARAAYTRARWIFLLLRVLWRSGGVGLHEYFTDCGAVGVFGLWLVLSVLSVGGIRAIRASPRPSRSELGFG